MPNSDKVQALIDRIHTGVENLTDGHDWAAWLRVQARFHRYSFNNTMLILSQRPDATMVAGFNAWKDMGRHVVKGSKGIGILAPSTRTEIDETTGEKIRRIVGFRVVYVFDISQTDGDPLPAEPPRAELLNGDAPHGLWDALAGQVKAAGYTVERGDCGSANGYTNPTVKTVRVRDDVDDLQAVKTLAHELAHIVLGHVDDMDDYHGCRGRCEVEAESVAAVVVGAHGVDTDGYSFPYISTWSDGDMDKVRETGERVAKAARMVLAGCDSDR